MFLGPGRFRPAPVDSYHCSAHRGSRADHLSFFTVTVVGDYVLLVQYCVLSFYYVLYFRATAAGYGYRQ